MAPEMVLKMAQMTAGLSARMMVVLSEMNLADSLAERSDMTSVRATAYPTASMSARTSETQWAIN